MGNGRGEQKKKVDNMQNSGSPTHTLQQPSPPPQSPAGLSYPSFYQVSRYLVPVCRYSARHPGTSIGNGMGEASNRTVISA